MSTRVHANYVVVPLVALVAAVVLAPACKTADISFNITLPSDVEASRVAWFEIGAYKDAACDAVGPMLGNGVPESADARVAFKSDEDPPTFGRINTGTYAFAVVAKSENCGVLASGCAVANVAKVKGIAVTLTKVEPATGACKVGAACEKGSCVPGNDNKSPGVGAGCSLELVGAGPLANPVGGSDTRVSAPAIAATPTGFVIAYRELGASDSKARVTVLPIDTGGGSLTPTQGFADRCSGADETDGTGLVMSAEKGQVVISHSPCGAKPALDVLRFAIKNADPKALDYGTAVLAGKFAVTSPSAATVQKFVLSDGHVAAGNFVVYTEDGAPRIATVRPEGVGAPQGTFGGATGMTGAWMAQTDQVLAVLAAGPFGATAPPAGDGGTEPPPTPTPGSDSKLGLIMARANTPADGFDLSANLPSPPIEPFPGTWASMAALGARVIVVSDGNGPASVSYRTFDLGRPPSGNDTGTFSIEGDGVVSNADVAMLNNDRVYFGALRPAHAENGVNSPGDVSVHVFAGATTTPRLIREVIFSKQPRIPSVALVRDGRVAVAATPSRVAVVWTTAKVLRPNDATGGYAVFACTP